MSSGLGGSWEYLAAAWWFVNGASQIRVFGMKGLRTPTVNAVTKEIRFAFDGSTGASTEDAIIVCPAVGATQALSATLLNIGGELFASVVPIGAANLQSGCLLVFKIPTVDVLST